MAARTVAAGSSFTHLSRPSAPAPPSIPPPCRSLESRKSRKMAARTVAGSSFALLSRLSAPAPRPIPLPYRSLPGSLRGADFRRYGAATVDVPEAELESPLQSPFPVQETQLLINGEFVDAASGKTFATVDPRTEEVIAHVAEGDKEDINRAVKAARKAFDEGPWPRLPAHERAKIIYRFADLLEKHNDELAALDAWDSGKPYDQARFGEMPEVVQNFRYYAGWADKIHGRTIATAGDHFAYTLHEPIGVCGQIIPWNFPMLMFSWKVAPALATGNTVVLKSAEQTPLSAILAGKLALEAGVPPGVLNIVSGFGETAGAALSGHMDVDKIAFTGSTEVGRLILTAAAQSNLKKVTLELGGKSPFIVFEDADIDKAVELAHSALFFNQGQCCTAGSRTYVHEKIYEEFVEKSKARALKRVVGDPFKSGVEQGPQVDEVQFNKILGYIEDGESQGAKLITGGARLGKKGFYIKPTIFGGVKDDMRIFNEEIFGPVQSLSTFKTVEEAVQRANRNVYGLAAAVVTNNVDTVNTVTRNLRAGSVWVNTYNVSDPSIPFGGYKQSGIGREKGIYGLDNYLQVKAVVTPLANAHWL